MSRHVNKREYTWSRFFWNEWRNDGLLQSCSLVTKGFWMDILCLMFNSERRGYLQVNGRPMTVLEISKMIHCDTRTVKRQLDILKERETSVPLMKTVSSIHEEWLMKITMKMQSCIKHAVGTLWIYSMLTVGIL